MATTVSAWLGRDVGEAWISPIKPDADLSAFCLAVTCFSRTAVAFTPPMWTPSSLSTTQMKVQLTRSARIFTLRALWFAEMLS